MDVDLVRRAFWCLASMDAELSAATGRPVHLALGSYDVSLPDVEVDGKEDANIAAFRLSIGAAELLRKGVETMVSRFRLNPRHARHADPQNALLSVLIVLHRQRVETKDMVAAANLCTDGRDRCLPVCLASPVSLFLFFARLHLGRRLIRHLMGRLRWATSQQDPHLFDQATNVSRLLSTFHSRIALTPFPLIFRSNCSSRPQLSTPHDLSSPLRRRSISHQSRPPSSTSACRPR